MLRRWHLDVHFLRWTSIAATMAAFAAMVVAAGSGCRTGNSEPAVSVTALRPPEHFVSGMTNFLASEDDESTRFDKGPIGGAPRHGTAVWGYYISTIEQEPWRTQLIEQEMQHLHQDDWPPPLSGPILNESDFQNRILELYIAVDVMPDQEPAMQRLHGLQMSAIHSLGDSGISCEYGDECLMFRAQAFAFEPPAEEQRMWRWRNGKIVITVSAFGAPGWPEELVTPLLQYYTSTGQRLGGTES